MARNSRSVIACVEAESATHCPSEVAYTLRGAVIEARLPERGGMRPVMRQAAASGPSIACSGSSSERSTTCPLPPGCSAARSATMTAKAPWIPATMSASARLGKAGGLSAKPFFAAKPLMASTRLPKPGRCA